jgi:hypothetical protein
MRTLWPLLCAALPLATPLSGCSNAYETFGPPPRVAEIKSCPAEKTPKKKDASAKTLASCTTTEKKDKPEPTGACITYQFMGGADCEALTKRKCYDNHMNVVDWRSGVACWKAALARAATAPAR